MTATPHSGRDSSLWALLRLLDIDAWGDRCPKKLTIPPGVFRRTPKEVMKDMAGNDLFKPRHPQTVPYELEGDEWALYEAVTDFVAVRLAEIRGSQQRTTAGFALTTMQRRVASSVRAIRRTLERRVRRLDEAIADPEDVPALAQGRSANPCWTIRTRSRTSTRSSSGSSRRRPWTRCSRRPSLSLRPSARRSGRCWLRRRTSRRSGRSASSRSCSTSCGTLACGRTAASSC